MPVKRKPTCESCKHAKPTETALICNRYPPVAVVLHKVVAEEDGGTRRDLTPVTMRVAIQPSDQACGEYESGCATRMDCV